MQCEEAREQLTDYVTNSVEEPLAPALAQHLMKCEACRSETEELKTLWTGLGTLPAAQPSSELQVRFDSMLAAYRDGLDHARTRSWWHSANSWWKSNRPDLYRRSLRRLAISGSLHVRFLKSTRIHPSCRWPSLDRLLHNRSYSLCPARQQAIAR